MLKHLFGVLLVCLFFEASAQNTFTDGSKYIDPTPYLSKLSEQDLYKHLSIIASDEFEGRETGTPGADKAADYIANHYKSIGLTGLLPNHFQAISFKAETWNAISLEINNKKYKHLLDYYALPNINYTSSFSVNEVVFAGYGIETDSYSDYKNGNVKDKLVLIYAGEPKKKNGQFIISGNESSSEWANDYRKKIKIAAQKGAKGILIIDPDTKENIQEHRNEILNSSMRMGFSEDPEGNFIPNMFISPQMAKELLGKNLKKVIKARLKIQKNKAWKPLTIPASVSFEMDKNNKLLEGKNVLGFLEGSDENLKSEIIVVSAHYDHLGKRGNSIFNGADDNGSGTSLILEIAEEFANAKKSGNGPRRSILFMSLSGEEKGLLGSEFYAANPVLPLEQTIANVNIDMIGRVDEAHTQDSNYIYVIGADKLSSELHEINEKSNELYSNITLDYKFNDENDPNRFYYRSDHYNFAKNGIPAIFYFSGVHEDYHRPEDDIEKIMLSKVIRIGKLAFGTIWELANRDRRIVVDKKG